MIYTKDKHGRRNGWLLPLWNVHEDPDLRPDQVYLTAIEHACSKGPHLHMRRAQRYYCVRGTVRVVVRRTYYAGHAGSTYTVHDLSPGRRLEVPAGLASMLINTGNGEAWVINMPSPAWHPHDQDDWPVEDWNYKP